MAGVAGLYCGTKPAAHAAPASRLTVGLGDNFHNHLLISLESSQHMAMMAMWGITITCRDASRLRYSELRDGAPQQGEIIETADAGQVIKARIDACYKEGPKEGSAPVFFQILATEI